MHILTLHYTKNSDVEIWEDEICPKDCHIATHCSFFQIFNLLNLGDKAIQLINSTLCSYFFLSEFLMVKVKSTFTVLSSILLQVLLPIEVISTINLWVLLPVENIIILPVVDMVV